jgi:hypothetical protein
MLITLLSDQGVNSLFVARIKAALMVGLPESRLIDLDHTIEPFDINEAAFVLSHFMADCPGQAIHLALVDMADIQVNPIIAHRDGQYIISSNNGLATVVQSLNQMEFDYIQPLPSKEVDLHHSDTRRIIELARQIALPGDKGITFDANKIVQKEAPRCMVSQGMLSGRVMYIDHLRNCYTNISRSQFSRFVGQGEFRINLSRHESVGKISNHKLHLDEGDVFCSFDHLGFMHFGIFKSKGADLLGMKKGTTITVEKL